VNAPHVAVDVRMLRRSGIGTYLRQVLPRVIAMRPDWRFSLLGDLTEIRDVPGLGAANTHGVSCTSPIYGIREQVELVRRIPGDADLMWSPHYNAPALSRVPLVLTIHDVAHLHERFVPRAWMRLYARTLMTAVTQRASAIICVSEFTRRELGAMLPATRARPVVIHNAVDAAWWSAPVTPARRTRPYFLFVGNVKPNKNLSTLLVAFDRMSATIPHDLLIVGKRDGFIVGDSGVADLASRHPNRVTFTGAVSDDELRTLVAGAEGLVFPSVYEGFGLPPLEAMAAGCPCIVSNAASMPEVCGDAALYFDPASPDELGDRMRELTSAGETRTRLIALGRERVTHYSWDRTAAETAAVIQSALDGSRRAV
jgi:glycosyltransferase involved in cell wall biosynthesis